jgi:hypothetical protein
LAELGEGAQRNIMTKRIQRVYRPRVQSPERAAEERALRERLHQERPNLQTLFNRGEVTQVYLMGEYWKRLRTFASLRTLGE